MNYCYRCEEEMLNSDVSCITCHKHFCQKCQIFPPMNHTYQCLECVSRKSIDRLIPSYYSYLSKYRQNIITTLLLCLRIMKPSPPKYIRFEILNCIYELNIYQLITNPCRNLLNMTNLCRYPIQTNLMCESCLTRTQPNIANVMNCYKCHKPDCNFLMKICNYCHLSCCFSCNDRYEMILNMGGISNMCISCYQQKYTGKWVNI